MRVEANYEIESGIPITKRPSHNKGTGIERPADPDREARKHVEGDKHENV